MPYVLSEAEGRKQTIQITAVGQKEKKIMRQKERKNKIFCKKAIDMDGKRFISSKTIFPSVVS